MISLDSIVSYMGRNHHVPRLRVCRRVSGFVGIVEYLQRRVELTTTTSSTIILQQKYLQWISGVGFDIL